MSNWGIFEPPSSGLEKLLPIKDPVLQELYANTRREWWYICHRIHQLLVEASQYGPSTSGANISRAVEGLLECEGAMAATHSADLMLAKEKS